MMHHHGSPSHGVANLTHSASERLPCNNPRVVEARATRPLRYSVTTLDGPK
jgi:hypothetical protein